MLLRLSGPLQSWGGASEFNRRETRPEPTKSGVLGLLAAAQGRRRQDDIADLLELSLGVRVDQPGVLLRDYHTVSDYRGVPLKSAAVNAKRIQKSTAPAKHTHVTQRYYLQDAVFAVAVGGPTPVVESLAGAVRAPAFPLALGRRSCVPAGRMVIDVRPGKPGTALRELPWQASERGRETYRRQFGSPASIDLPVTVDDPQGKDVLADVPTTFDPLHKALVTRTVSHGWASVPTGYSDPDQSSDSHDPFALLGW